MGRGSGGGGCRRAGRGGGGHLGGGLGSAMGGPTGCGSSQVLGLGDVAARGWRGERRGRVLWEFRCWGVVNGVPAAGNVATYLRSTLVAVWELQCSSTAVRFVRIKCKMLGYGKSHLVIVALAE